MGGILRRNAWLLPAAFAALLGVVGFSAYRALERTLDAQVASKLETLRDAAVAALEIWAEEQRAVAEVHANAPAVRAAALELFAALAAGGSPREPLLASPAQSELRELLGPVARRHGYRGFGVLDPSGLLLAAARDGPVGTRPPLIGERMPRVLEGHTVVTPPLALQGARGSESRSTILVIAPLRGEAGDVVGGVGFAVPPDAEFATLLTVARSGETGETYAFDANGLLLSPSRFEDQLREIGLLPGDPAVGSFLRIQVRDPGGDLTRGFEPELPLMARPLTRAAASAVSGVSGVDVAGFRDYRGVRVVAAWSWIPDLGIGITSEMDAGEAYRGLFELRWRFAAVSGVLVLGALGMLVYSLVVMRLRRQVEEVGRYRIERKLGSGGMGSVYLARHALLRRPTAIKILSADRADAEDLARFEREVQVSSALSHPNTISIYDYGRTPEGTFYYAMEYVQGPTLGACVRAQGAMPEARVLHVMRQACASIAEAHAAGLMHRDLKPSNIMLCERGGCFDFVKVLDFGLVKAQGATGDPSLTDTTSLTGTPLYLPPEAAQGPEAVDLRGDVYQLGLVAWYLLVGRPVFEGETPVDVILRHVNQAPEPPSQALGRPLPVELEKIVLRCLEKRPDDRFPHAGELLAALESCEILPAWGQREARAWWTAWRELHPEEEDRTPGTPTYPSAYRVDLGGRLD